MKPFQNDFFCGESHSVIARHRRIFFRVRVNPKIRKSRLVVSPEEGLVIETPRKTKLSVVRQIVLKRQEWVLDSLLEIREQYDRARKIKRHKNSVLIFGKEKKIQIKTEQPKNFIEETKKLIVIGSTKSRLTQREAQLHIKKWLQERAKQYLPIRVRQLNRNRFKIKKIFIKEQKSLWGSYSSSGSLQLNWRLIMAPRFAADYIIHHELCHAVCLDHSTKFWKLVGKVCPRYEKAEEWFHHYGFLMNIHFNMPSP